MALVDPHSYTDSEQPITQRASLDLTVDFERKCLEGNVLLELDRPASGRLDLDTRDLTISRVETASGQDVPFELDATDPIKGARLRLSLSGSDKVRLHFTTSVGASALQWLEPSQTAGGAMPYVFTQCQAIHARSVFPCQDTPAARIRYDAKLRIPKNHHAVMAAAHVKRELDGDFAVEHFHMEQPIPSYLFAFAVGNLVSKDLGPRSRVWAEPEVVEAAAYEFHDVEKMIAAAESLFGPYDWERFDILIMPPSFPYGGMENPRMTFLTPTLLAGDRSLVNVLAHELAHSWTGNLVTNATMNDFWLNEGFTTYAERRILEALEGPERVALHAAIGFKGLAEEIERFGATNPLTRLRNELDGVDPDQVYSRIPYEKGYLFLRRLEEAMGRDAFDQVLKRYISKFQFMAIDTAQFLNFLKAEAPSVGQTVDLELWIDGPGVPDDAPRARSDRLDQIMSLASAFGTGKRPTKDDVGEWSAQEWELYLQALPRQMKTDDCDYFEDTFQFSESKNAEIRLAWLTIAAHSAYSRNFEAIKGSLMTLGRMKYLRPLYIGLLNANAETRKLAKSVFNEAESRYHPVAASVIRGLIDHATGAQ